MLTTKHLLAKPIIQHRSAPQAQPFSKDNQKLKEISWPSRERSPWNTVSNTATYGKQQRKGGGVGNTQVGENTETRSTILKSMVEDRNLDEGGTGMLAR